MMKVTVAKLLADLWIISFKGNQHAGNIRTHPNFTFERDAARSAAPLNYTLAVKVILFMSRVKHKLKLLLIVTALVMAMPSFSTETAGEGQDLGWAIWSALSESAKSCKSEGDTSNFLDTGSMVIGDPVHSKVYSNVVETLAMENPQCFLSSANSLQPRALKLLIERFLTKPKKHSIKEIEISLSKHWEQSSYSKFLKVYMEARQ